MRSLGAVVVGIGRYRYDSDQFPPLRYASSDAEQFVGYLETCWRQSNDASVLQVKEKDATTDVVTKAFATLARTGPFDLQLVFLSGHGWVTPRDAGFVVQPNPGSSNLSLLDSVLLDRLLASVPAVRTIFILDCCYAEGIVRRMRFFSALDGADARLFVASSREQQRTWEDDRIGHGIFTAHLVDLLNTGSSINLKGVRDKLDVDGELFPMLCDQVPLYVLEHKQQCQEPVKGGISMRTVSLPVAWAARRVKERSAFATAVRRLRQIATAIAATCIVGLFFAYVLLYYAEVAPNGAIRLHHGTKWLAPVFRFLPTLRVETGLSALDLSDDPAARYRLQAGAATGFWTHTSLQGYRAWYDNIRPSLSTLASARYDVLVATGSAPPVSRLGDESRPSEIAFAAWALLDGSDDHQLDTLLAHVLGADRTSPLVTTFLPNDLDFDILDRTQSQLANYADALRSAAAVDPDRTFRGYVGFIKASQMWLAHSSLEQHGSEARRRVSEDVADVLAVIVKARVDRGQGGLDGQMRSLLNELAEAGYGELIHQAMSRVADSPIDRQNSATRALTAFHGDSYEPTEAAALRTLKATLDASPASQAIVEEVYKRFVDVGGSEQSDLTAFLIVAADQQALPGPVMNILLEKAKDAVARNDGAFMDTEYARILAHGMREVSESSRPLVNRLIEMVTARVTPIASSTAEMYTALGRQGLATPAIVQQIIAQAAAAPPYRPKDPGVVNEPLPGMAIVVGYGPWLEALAVLGTAQALPRLATDILEKHADDPTLRDTILRALVRQPPWVEESCWKTSCSRMLSAFSGDAVKRQLASDLLAERLAGLPRGEFLAAIDALHRERQVETEPEVRIALGLAVINAQRARVRVTPLGDQLFE